MSEDVNILRQKKMENPDDGDILKKLRKEQTKVSSSFFKKKNSYKHNLYDTHIVILQIFSIKYHNLLGNKYLMKYALKNDRMQC